MIAALARLQERLVDGGEALPAGWERRKLTALVCVNEAGLGIGLRFREEDFPVPVRPQRANSIAPGLAWDTPEYALGIPRKSSPERTAEMHRLFRLRLDALDCDDPGLEAVRRFLAREGDRLLSGIDQVAAQPGATLGFILLDDEEPVHLRPAVRAAIQDELDRAADPGEDAEEGQCSITGRDGAIARLHPKIRFPGGRASGTSLVSFNAPSLEHFGREQGGNAAVGEGTAADAAAALNALLAPDSLRRLMVEGLAVLAWTEGPSPAEGRVIPMLEGSGDIAEEDLESSDAVHLAVLAPRDGRLSVQLWETLPMGTLAARIAEWRRRTRLPADAEPPPHWAVLRSIQRGGGQVPHGIATAYLRAMVLGLPLPPSLVRPAQEAVLAALAARRPVPPAIAIVNHSAMEGREPMNEDILLPAGQQSEAYRLGRFFAVVSCACRKAGLDRNAPQAAMRPRAMAERAMAKYNGYSMGKGLRVHYDKIIDDILAGVSDPVPETLGPVQRGEFILGFHHQRKAIFTKGKGN